MRAQGEYGAGPNEQREAQDVVRLSDPAGSRDDFACQEVRPAACRDIVIHLAILCEDRRHQHGVDRHILPNRAGAGRIIGELKHHRAHHRHAGIAGLAGHGIEARH